MQTGAQTRPVLTDADAVPTGPAYAYHETQERNRRFILREGIQPMDRGPAGSEVDAFLQQHGDSTGIHRPQHRSDCVFLYSEPGRGLNPSEEVKTVVTFVIDLEAVDNPIYTADYDLASDLYGVVSGEERQQVARDYWQSCRPFEPGDDSEGELLVEGGVPSEAITHVYNPHEDDGEDGRF